MRRPLRGSLCVALGLVCLAGAAAAQRGAAPTPEEDLVQLDFQDAELSAVIDTIARLTDTNFIYDDRVRGRVTVVSPAPMPVEQAYAVFESILQVKGFTTVRTPGGALKVIPLRDAKESSIETRESRRLPLDRDRFVTRLIPLRYIDAPSIVNTLKPLVSKDAAMAAYEPTNTVILTESASNIRRIMSILESVDVETYKEELAVIRVEYADAGEMAQQISEIYGAEVQSSAAPARAGRGRRRNQQAAATAAEGRTHGRVRILTDARTNSLIVLAARSNLEDVRKLVRMLDVPIPGGGRIHVYYLNHANSEELAATLSSLITGLPSGGGAVSAGGGGGQGQAVRAAVTGLTEGLSVTADPATNSLVIQATQEGYTTLRGVIEKLDVQRPQVLVEALIMEVDVSDGLELGMSWIYEFINQDFQALIAQGTQGALQGASGGMVPTVVAPLAAGFLVPDHIPGANSGTITALIRASASDAGTNILSAPHILTSDNEQAEIRIGDNIPIITSRVEQPTGAVNLSSSVNVERQDVGVTLRVTPQITEGDTLRLEIYQEITAINEGLSGAEGVGNAEDVGVPLSNRSVENTVVVDDGETVVIGGLISDEFQDTVTKIPWLGDIPVLGWAFKSTKTTVRKVNLLVFLTPHIIREADDLEYETVRKREEFIGSAEHALHLDDKQRADIAEERSAADAAGEPFQVPSSKNSVRTALLEHETRYPAARLGEIEEAERERRAAATAAAEADVREPRFHVQAAVLEDQGEATRLVRELIDAGWGDTHVESTPYLGRVRFEVRIGPFPTLDGADAAARTVERSHQLSPSILVLPGGMP